MTPPVILSCLSPVLRTAMLACVALMLAGPTALRADLATKSVEKPKKEKDDKKKEKSRFDYLPEARPLEARFTSGTPVVIELLAAVGSLKQMEFTIRQEPRNGTLSVIRPDLREGHKATVVYSHHGGDVPLNDTFTYACRLDGGSWSAPATVTLTGQRMEPRIDVVSLPQFGRVYLGGETSAKVAVRNTGKADFRTELKWPEPFRGPPFLEVAKGELAEFQVFAKPGRTGEFRHEVTLQTGLPDSRIIFYFTCVQALSVSPSRMVLTLDPSSGERNGVLSLANARPQPAQVAITRPPRLLAPEKVEVAGGSRSDLRIALPAGDVEEFSGEIEVMSEGAVQRVSVTAASKPATLQVLVPASLALDFGTVDQSAATSREIVLNNAGGRTLIVEARTRPPYNLGEAAKSIRIEPRQQARLKVTLQSDGLGAVPGELELNSNATRVTVALSAEVRAVDASVAAIKSAAVSAPVPSAPAVASFASVAASDVPPSEAAAEIDPVTGRRKIHPILLSLAASRGLPIPSAHIDPNLASITSMEVISTSSKEAIIAWPKPAVIPPGWIIEIGAQVMDPSTGIFLKLWQRHRDWETVEVDGDRVAVRLQNLSPASLYEIRVLAVNREGKVSEPAATLVVQTDLPWRVPPWMWRVLIVSGLGVAVYFLYRMRQGGFRLASA